ncbi:MAG: hypothetical protein DME88_05640 [Verrucomicrobia bacterium]|jgi:hypothetical protein|nr:MAG: hypothetical protein DME88_05640 [Verrucomicrobiota bacterium]
MVWGGTLTLPRQSSRSQQLARVPRDGDRAADTSCIPERRFTRNLAFSLICVLTARLLNRSHALNQTGRKHIRIIAIAVLILMTLGMAQAEPCHSQRNYILRRQEAMPALGTPTFRMNYGKRKIDYYRNGLMFEGDNVVGVSKR